MSARGCCARSSWSVGCRTWISRRDCGQSNGRQGLREQQGREAWRNWSRTPCRKMSPLPWLVRERIARPSGSGSGTRRSPPQQPTGTTRLQRGAGRTTSGARVSRPAGRAASTVTLGGRLSSRRRRPIGDRRSRRILSSRQTRDLYQAQAGRLAFIPALRTGKLPWPAQC